MDSGTPLPSADAPQGNAPNAAPKAQSSPPAPPTPPPPAAMSPKAATPPPVSSGAPPKHSTPLFTILLALAALGGAVAAVAYVWLPDDILNTVAKKQAAPFVIGGILPLTGDGASFGVPIKEAAVLAQTEINEKGGIGGAPIEIVWRDGKCEGADAAIAAEDLIQNHDIKILIGGACSGEVLASAPLAETAGLLTVSSASTNPGISDLPNVFRTAPSDELAGKIASQYARDTLGIESAAIITEDTAYAQGLRDVFRASFEQAGGTVVVDEVFDRGTSDFSEAIARIKEAAPDLVYILPQTPAPGVLIVKELKEQEVPATYLTAEVLLIRDAVVEQGDILEGVIGIEVLFDKENPRAATMLTNYERVYGREAIYPHFMGGIYDLMYLIKESFERTDGSTQAVSAYLSGLRAWPGTIGPVTFDSFGDPSLPYQIIKITNKTTERIDVVTPGGM